MAQETFRTLLRESGVVLSDDNMTPHVLNKELSLAKRELQAKLTPEVLYDFINQLKEHCKNEDAFKNALSMTSLQKSSTPTKPHFQNSIIHLCLTIAPLQNSVMQLVLEKLAEKVVDEDLQFVTAILHSLNYIPVINDEDALAKSLVESIDIAEFNVQLIILEQVSKIISDQQCNKVADRLLTLMGENENLTEPIMCCLNDFYLSSETKARISSFIIKELLNRQRYHKIFPLLFQSLWFNVDEKSVLYDSTRLAMDKLMISDKHDVKSKLHVLLKSLVGRSKQFLDTILKMRYEDTKPIDFYMFILLYMNSKSKAKVIEASLKNRIKQRAFGRQVIEKFFDTYFTQQIMDDFHAEIRALAFVLIQSNSETNRLYGEMGTLMFEQLFVHKLCDMSKRKVTLFKLNGFIQCIDCKSDTILLHMLKDLSMAHELDQHSGNLMAYLNLKDKLSLRNLKLLFEILCQNVLKLPNFVEQLRQVITKLLFMLDDNVVKKGIIGAIIMAKYLSIADDNNSEPADEPAPNDSPVGIAKELLEYTQNICGNNAERLGLYYDELALSISSETHTEMLAWLQDELTKRFENVYILFGDATPQLSVALKAQYELNTADEIDEALNINIGEFVQKSNLLTKITVMTPLFRLLRQINHHNNFGDMSRIDALLGCGVMLPDVADLDEYAPAELKVVADCLFHCINWFRELISAFINDKGYTSRIKVIQRVKHIVELEGKLDECMALLLDHKLPPSYFYNETMRKVIMGRGPPPAKKTRYPEMTINTTAGTSSSGRCKRPKSAYNFREIDTDVLMLLKYPVTTSEMTASQMKSLQSTQFQFILQDSIGKLEAILNKRSKGVESLNAIKPEDLISDCEHLVPYVHKQFRQVAREIAALLANHAVDDDDHASTKAMTTAYACDLKHSFDLVIHFYTLIFSWSGFALDQYRDLLKKYLKYFHTAENSASLDDSIRGSLTLASNNRMAHEFVQIIAKYSEQCLLLSTASNMIRLMQQVRALQTLDTSGSDKVIVQTASAFVKMRWNEQRGKVACDQLEVITTAYLDDVSVQTISGIVGTLRTEVQELRTKNDPLTTFRSIDKRNIHMLYRCVCHRLITQLKDELRHLPNNEHLVLWRSTTLTLQDFIAIAKTLKTNNNMKTFARYGVRVINVFLSHGLPMMEIMLRKHPDDVQEILTILQTTTKFLHQLCCQVVHSKHAGFLNMVPQIRSTLEKLVFSVKAILVANNCAEAFWTGVLKNRDIQGEDILSQTDTQTTSDADEEEEEEDDDGDGSDLSDYATTVSMHYNDNESTPQSDSEVMQE